VSGSGFSEGLISFQESASSLSNVNIPQYLPKDVVTKLVDNIFFDQASGNIIRVFSPESSMPSNIDLSGSTITSINIIPRKGNGLTYSSTPDSSGKITPCPNSIVTTPIFSEYKYSWVNPDADTTGEHQVIYMPWGYGTVIQLFNTKNNLFEGTFLFNSGNVAFSNTSAVSLTLPTKNYGPDKKTIGYISTPLPLYDSSYNAVYQVSDFVLFDVTNGNLIVQTSAGINIYPGTSTANTVTTDKYKPTKTSVEKRASNTSPNLASFLVSDPSGSNIVLYVPDGKHTMISVFTFDSSTNLLGLRKVVRFDPNGLDFGGGDGDDDDTDYGDDTRDFGKDGSSGKSSQSPPSLDEPPSLDDVISNYYNQYWGQNATMNGGTNQYSNDFMLKTQIVPPICPACPNCPSATTCTNCGGNGGAGTYGAGSVGASAGAVLVDAIDTTGDVAKDAIDTTGDVAKDVLLGAGMVGGGALFGAGALAGGALAGAGELGEGALNLLGGAAGSAENAASRAANSIYNMGQPMQSGQNGQPGPGAYTQNYGGYGQPPQTNSKFAPVAPGTTDNYSYYGALSSKGGDPVPITSDFSKFGR